MAKYLIKNMLARTLIQYIDSLLHPAQRVDVSIDKILISHLGHLGDVVMSTCVLQPLKKKFPNAQIGFLTHSATRVVVEKHPLVDFVHSLDHWYESGVWRYYQTRRSALKEVRSQNYSASIDLGCHFPNAIPFFTKAEIPHRIGYESGGFGPMLTHPFPWVHEQRYVGFSYLHLLSGLGVDETSDPCSYYPLEMGSKPQGLPSNYIVFHPGSSSSAKEWPLASWRMLAQKMSLLGRLIVITGKGMREAQNGALIAKNLSCCMNFVDASSWEEFAYIIQHASLVISSDSVAVHLAASQKIPTIVLFAGINHLPMWRPPYPECQVLQYPVHCSPCLNKKGCKSMACIRNIPVEMVINIAKNISFH
jgi:ADP-heptose:LPS heptosyltransferase